MARGTLRVRIIGDASDLQRTLGNATGRLTRFARHGALALGAATVAGVAASVRSFANFDQAMTNSLAIMGDVSDTMRRDMSNAAREVATTTQFSATQAAEAYFFLASAGLDAAASIEAMPRVAAFAQAGQFDLARATDLLTDAQSALGMAADDTAENLQNMIRVSDVLVRANTLANASVEQFSEALTQKAGAALRNLNKDVEEGVAVLAVYADQGSKGSEAGTRLNATLEGLTRTARENRDEYERLNVAVFDSQGEMRNMADIVSDLEGAFAGMSTEQRDAELASLGLTRQARDGIIALLGNSEAIRDYESALRDAAGTTDEVANNQMQTFWAQLGLVKDQFVDVGLSIGEALMPALMEFANWFQERLPVITSTLQGWSERFVEFFTGTSSAVSGNVEVMDGWAASAIAARERVLTDYEKFPAELRARLPVPEDFNEFIDASGTAGDTAGNDMMDRLRDAVQQVWEGDIKPWFDNEFVPWFREDFGPRASDLFWEMGEAAMLAFGKGAINRLGQIDINIFQALDDAVNRMYGWFGDKWNRSGQDAGQEAGEHMGQGLGDGASSMQGHVEGATSELVHRGIQAARDAAEIRSPSQAFYRIGVSMGQGLRDGLDSMRSSIITAAETMVSNAVEAARRLMRISSPSQVTAQQIGVPMAEGLNTGLTRNLLRMPANTTPQQPVTQPTPTRTLTVNQTFNTSPSRDTLAEARHQQRLAFLEAV
jgi:TP901 family phage tail tape measure protein